MLPHTHSFEQLGLGIGCRIKINNTCSNNNFSDLYIFLRCQTGAFSDIRQSDFRRSPPRSWTLPQSGSRNCQATRRCLTTAGVAAAGLLTSPRRRVTSQSAAVFRSACSTPRPRRASIRQALTPVTSATVTQNLDLARHRAAHRTCSDWRTEFV